MASDARPSKPDAQFAPYDVVRTLGSRPVAAYAARHTPAGGKQQLFVVELFAGAAKTPHFVADAKRLATLASPNVARVRDVATHGDDVLVASEFVDGEKLRGVWRAHDDRMSLEIALRVLIDVLSGVGALHNLRDAKQQPMKIAHGEVSPATIVLGSDGVARVLHVVARRAPGAPVEKDSIAYLAPEAHAGEACDQRSDVFSAGVLLWEALTGKSLFTESDGATMAARVRAKQIPAATVPEKAPWAKGLVDVAAKALAASPDDRWPTVAAMAAEIRKAAGLKLAPASTAASFVRSVADDRIKARRAMLESGDTTAAASKVEPSPPPARARVASKPDVGRPVAIDEAAQPAPVMAAPKPPPQPQSPAPPPSSRVGSGTLRPPDATPATAPAHERSIEVVEGFAESGSDDTTTRAVVASAAQEDPTKRLVVEDEATNRIEVETTAEPIEDESTTRSVVVAPGVEAPLADVVELSSESLLEAADSVPPPPAAAPPAPSPAPAPASPPVARSAKPTMMGGFVLDPAAVAARLEKAASPAPPTASPPPKPAAASPPPAPVREAEEAPPVSGAPEYAAAIDVPISVPPPRVPDEKFTTSPSLVKQAEAASRIERRKKMVFIGVGALGISVFLLAAWRVTHSRAEDTSGTTTTTVDTTTATQMVVAPPPSAATLAPAPPPPSPATAPVAATTTAAPEPSPTPVAPPPPPPPATSPVAAKPPAPPPPPPPAQKPPVTAAPPAAPPPAQPKPRPKPKFDPNSL